MTTRTLTADRSGPVLLDLTLPAGTMPVTAEPDRDTAEVTITARGQDPAVADAVRDAALWWSPEGGFGGTLTVQVPEVNSGGFQGVTFGRGGTSVTQILGYVPAGATVTGLSITGAGGIRVGDGTVIVNGVPVAGSQVEISARVPEGSLIRASSRAADLTARGEYAAVVFASTSGDLDVGGVGELIAETVSGDVRAACVARRARLKSTSGDICIERIDVVVAESVSGDIHVVDLGGEAGWVGGVGGLATLCTVSGNITLHATENGRVDAVSQSGDITVTAEPTALAKGLSVTANSRTGHVTTPDTHPAPPTARPRRPRRT